MQAEGENKDQLKVRVGSSWLNFADYMTQVKAKLEREGDGEEAAFGEIEAALEDPLADAPVAPTTPSGKSKKKKKKAKKKAGADMDLDMDNDDAAE